VPIEEEKSVDWIDEPNRRKRASIGSTSRIRRRRLEQLCEKSVDWIDTQEHEEDVYWINEPRKAVAGTTGINVLEECRLDRYKTSIGSTSRWKLGAPGQIRINQQS